MSNIETISQPMSFKSYVKYFFLDYLHVDKEYYQNSQLEENLKIGDEKLNQQNISKVFFNAEDSYYGQLRTVFNKFHRNVLTMTLTVYQTNISQYDENHQRIRIWRVYDKRKDKRQPIQPQMNFIPLSYYQKEQE